MSIAEEVKNVLDTNKEKNAKLANFARLRHFIREKRERGIITKKPTRMPSLQEIERYGYEMFLTRGSA